MIFSNPIQQKIDFNALPQAVSQLISQVEDLRGLLLKQGACPKHDSALDSIAVCAYIQQKGIPMSKSRLYKLVSDRSGTFPFHRAGNRLIFYTNELDAWCDTQIKHPINSHKDAIDAIVKSAQNKHN